MVISVKKARENPRLKGLEKNIDKEIKKEFNGSNERVMYTLKDSENNPSLIDGIKEIYQKAGWEVNYVPSDGLLPNRIILYPK